MKKIEESNNGGGLFKTFSNIKPYKITSRKISAAAIEKELSSERMKIANEVVTNLIIMDEPEEEE